MNKKSILIGSLVLLAATTLFSCKDKCCKKSNGKSCETKHTEVKKDGEM